MAALHHNCLVLERLCKHTGYLFFQQASNSPSLNGYVKFQFQHIPNAYQPTATDSTLLTIKWNEKC